MVESDAQSTQQAALRRLLQADLDAQAQKQRAHEGAKKILADGEEEARRLVDAARASAEVEVAAYLERARAQAQAEAEKARQEAQQAVEVMNRRARQRRSQAVAFLVAWVTSET